MVSCGLFILICCTLRYSYNKIAMVRITWMLHYHTAASYHKSGVPNPVPQDLSTWRIQIQPWSKTPVGNFKVLLKISSWFSCAWSGLELNRIGCPIHHAPFQKDERTSFYCLLLCVHSIHPPTVVARHVKKCADKLIITRVSNPSLWEQLSCRVWVQLASTQAWKFRECLVRPWLDIPELLSARGSL